MKEKVNEGSSQLNVVSFRAAPRHASASSTYLPRIVVANTAFKIDVLYIQAKKTTSLPAVCPCVHEPPKAIKKLIE